MADEKPGMAARAYLEQAEHYLNRWKAVGAEFADGTEMPAEKASERELLYKEFERLDDLATKATAAAEEAAKADEFAARKAALLGSTGRIPVGVGVTAKAAGEEDEAGQIVYKAHNGKPGEVSTFIPSQSLTDNWTAKAEASYTDIFRRYLARGTQSMKAEDYDMQRQKALSAGVDTAGGFWVVPEVFATEFLSTLADEVMMRRLATVMPAIPRGSRLVIRTASGLDAAEWTTEIGSATLDASTPAGQRALTPHPLAKAVRISNTLLEGSPVGVEAYVRGEISALFEAAEESAGMTGGGAGRWEGIYTSTLPTDVTCASATSIAYADLLDVEGALKAQYLRNAQWIMHRTIRKELLSLVDGQGLPLLRRDPAAASRFDLFGYPINISEYSPSSSASAQYVAALGDWKRAYRIVDSLAVRIVRDEVPATDQVDFYARKESDGMIVDGNGLVRLKMNT